MPPQYDLEERTESFAKNVRDFVKHLPKDLANTEYSRQLIRASGSVGANYIEANEALSRKDLLLRLKISRKEAKESRYWLRLISPTDGEILAQNQLIRESSELLMILSAIINKLE